MYVVLSGSASWSMRSIPHVAPLCVASIVTTWSCSTYATRGSRAMRAASASERLAAKPFNALLYSYRTVDTPSPRATSAARASPGADFSTTMYDPAIVFPAPCTDMTGASAACCAIPGANGGAEEGSAQAATAIRTKLPATIRFIAIPSAAGRPLGET